MKIGRYKEEKQKERRKRYPQDRLLFNWNNKESEQKSRKLENVEKDRKIKRLRDKKIERYKKERYKDSKKQKEGREKYPQDR